MKHSNLHKVQIDIDDASLQTRDMVIDSNIRLLQADCSRLEQEKTNRTELYHDKRRKTHDVESDTTRRPLPIPEDKQNAKQYRVWAWAGLLLEIILAVWVFVTMLSIDWPFAVVTTVLLALFAHVLILVMFHDVSAPKRSIRNIRRYIFYPSLFIFIPSAAILLLSRSLSGFMSVALLPVYGIALWATTIGLLPLVGSLFAMAYLIDWSSRDAKEFDQIEKELAETSSFLKKLQSLSVENVRIFSTNKSKTNGEPNAVTVVEGVR